MYEEKFMREALRQARRAAADGEVPIGAVIVQRGVIVARGRNKREKKKNSLCHAEIIAINKACRRLGGWRLPGCEMYITLEPCPMCSGAIIQSRIDRVYFGAYDKKAGCAGSVCSLFDTGMFNYDTKTEGGYLEDECAAVLSDFFAALRKRKK